MSKLSMDALFQACGTHERLNLVVTDQRTQASARWVLPQPFAVLGRSSETDLQLDAEAVSRRHVYLQVLRGRVLFLDLRSRTGTFFGNQSHRAGWLDPSASIRVGPFDVQLVRDTGTGDASSTASRDLLPVSTDLPALHLRNLNGDGANQLWSIEPQLALVGHSSICNVRLEHVSVSGIHCSLLRTPLGPWVVDLRGLDGIHVNGARVRFARLVEGDEVRVGNCLLGIHCQETPTSAASLDEASQSGRSVAIAPGPDHRFATSVSSVPPGTALQPSHGSAVGTQPGGPAETRAWIEAVVLPLVGQFMHLQQKSFDQFRQSMLETFQTLHKDHVSDIRQEMSRLSTLTAEIHELRARLGQTPDASAPSSAPSATPHANGTLSDPQVKSGPTVAPQPQNQVPPPPSVDNDSLPKRNAAEPPTQQQVPAPEAPEQGNRSKVAHDWLNQRIHELQQEQQGVWKRIWQRLFGPRTQI